MLIISNGRGKRRLFMIAVTICVLTVGVIGARFMLTRTVMDSQNTLQVATKVTNEFVEPPASDFFTEYRLERDKVRSEKSEVLQAGIKNAKNEEARVQAQEAILKIFLEKQQELELENLIKASGFSDALVFLNNHSVHVVVKTASLSQEDAEKITELIGKAASIKAEDIIISAKP